MSQLSCGIGCSWRQPRSSATSVRSRRKPRPARERPSCPGSVISGDASDKSKTDFTGKSSTTARAIARA